MSKIQITELTQNASRLNVLNAQETTEVVGGYGYGGYSYSYSTSSYVEIKTVDLNQESVALNTQTVLGGDYGSYTSASNYVNQGNNANISLGY